MYYGVPVEQMETRFMRATIFVTILGVIGFGHAVHAQGLLSVDEQLAANGLASEQLRDGLHVLYFPAGGNVVASIGAQGVLLVDDHFTESVPLYQAKIRELGGGDIDLVVNTHWHFDHAQGNSILGPQGAWIVSHANSREMMSRDNVINIVVSPNINQPAYETIALPVATFDESMQLHFNDERIDLRHYGSAHTTGDAAVILRGSNVVHLGDVYNTAGYPFIDVDNGGDIDGVIRFCEGVLMEIDEDTIVVPGHGRVSDYAGLRAYVAMLKTIRDRVAALIEQGSTLEDVLAANPTVEWDQQLGDPRRLLDRAYASLSR